MGSASTGPHSEGSLDVCGAGLETWRDNRDVIEASDHVAVRLSLAPRGGRKQAKPVFGGLLEQLVGHHR